MKKLSVATMRCEKCVARISGALEEAGIAFEISLEDKLVSVDEAKVAEAIEALDDLGFEAVEAQVGVKERGSFLRAEKMKKSEYFRCNGKKLVL